MLDETLLEYSFFKLIDMHHRTIECAMAHSARVENLFESP